jgi:hypothetical protein
MGFFMGYLSAIRETGLNEHHLKWCIASKNSKDSLSVKLLHAPSTGQGIVLE